MIKIPSILVVASLIAAGALHTGDVAAAPIAMAGNFLSTQISDDGTLGNGGASPGLLHDPTGTGTFDPVTEDYLRPGFPFEAFGISSDQTGLIGNNNNNGGGGFGGSDAINQQVSLTDLSAGSLNHVRWSGSTGAFTLQHDYLFDDNDERINITTTITALTALTNLTFSRAIDPDPDNYSGGSAITNNERGLDLNNDGDYTDPGEQKPSDFVSAEGALSGRAIAMFTDSAIAHNSGIALACCSEIDPALYLSGGDFSPVPGFDSVGDDGLGLGFDIGSLGVGESISITYAYVFGDTVGTVDIPGDEIPEPTGIGLFGFALAGMGYARRRRTV